MSYRESPLSDQAKNLSSEADLRVAPGNGLDTNQPGTLNLGRVNATNIGLGVNATVDPVGGRLFVPLNPYSPTAAMQEGAVSLVQVNNNGIAMAASGDADYFLAYFLAGRIINSISFICGSTPSGGLTHSWAAVYTATTAPTLLGQSADNTTAEWTAQALRTFSGGSLPIQITSTGYYYVALSVTATTVNTVLGLGTIVGASRQGPMNGMHFADTTHTGLAGTAANTATTGAAAIASYAYWYIS